MSDESPRVSKRIITSMILLVLFVCSNSLYAFDGETRKNRLENTSSPYLLHHADNPVDWYPWGPEALKKAKKENKPIFLSVGYSSCYWCHVMERLVFSDEKIAGYMNEHFINIKVDREERPDIDEIYMTSLILYFQATGSPQGGGWPLSMFLTPEAKPFAGGTYFPPVDQGGRPGFSSVLARVDQLWKEKEKDVRQNAELLTEYVRKSSDQTAREESVPVGIKLTMQSIDAIKDSFDTEYGGVDFSLSHPDAPKFPVPVKLVLLQKAARDYADKEAGEMVKKTLDQMANGGLHDHLGGGFHRYSTDRKWHVPHFEKMLYDQAQLISVYVEEYRRTNNAFYKEVAEEACDFVLRELTDSNGGFLSALDAETDGVEGKYYVWEKEEVLKLLGKETSAGFLEAYGFNESDKFEHGVVLHRNKSLKSVAKELDRSESKLTSQLNEQKKILFNARLRRKPLNKDDKVLTSWNGLMISALAEAGSVLGRQDYLEASEHAARFILDNMLDSEKKLLHSWYHGKADLNAYLDDYAFLIKGMLTLHEVTKKEEWLIASKELTEKQITLFWDETGNGFYFTAVGHEELIARPKTSYDSVIPSGNSISVLNLIYIWKSTGDDRYQEYARKTLSVHAAGLKKSPRGMAAMALGMGEYLAILQSKKSQINNEVKSTVSQKVAQGELVLVSGKPTDPKPKKKDELVQASIFLSKKKLIPGEKCEALLVANIKKGWHINANPAKPDGFVPTVFSIESKNKVKLEKIYYPKGKPFSMAGIDEKLSVYEKRVIFYGVLTAPKDLKGDKTELSFNIRYQACNDNICKKPITVKLPASVPLAKPGEKVASNNEKLFHLYKKSVKDKKKKKD